MVLGVYYAKARMYDADNRRFMAIDPVKDGLNWYAYCENNPIKYVDPTGKMWTDIDQQIYLKVRDDFGNIPARKYWESIDKATQDFIDAKGNWFFKNQARYAAVEARTQYYFYVFKCYYDDTFDYTQGKGNEFIFLGVHAVFGTPWHHTCIVIFVAPGSTYYDNNDARFIRTSWGEKMKYATIGADSNPLDEQRLKSELNRDSDSNLSIKKEMIPLDFPGKSTTKAIEELFFWAERFKSGTLRYDFNAGTVTVRSQGEVVNQYDAYNSNSFTRGLLRQAGMLNPPNPSFSVPGWNFAVPQSSFR